MASTADCRTAYKSCLSMQIKFLPVYRSHLRKGILSGEGLAASTWAASADIEKGSHSTQTSPVAAKDVTQGKRKHAALFISTGYRYRYDTPEVLQL